MPVETYLRCTVLSSHCCLAWDSVRNFQTFQYWQHCRQMVSDCWQRYRQPVRKQQLAKISDNFSQCLPSDSLMRFVLTHLLISTSKSRCQTAASCGGGKYHLNGALLCHADAILKWHHYCSLWTSFAFWYVFIFKI